VRAVAFVLSALAGLAARGVHAAPSSETLTCAGWELDARIKRHLKGGAYLDAHNLAETATAICSRAAPVAHWHLWNAVALFHLDEPLRAQSILRAVREEPGPAQADAATLMAWTHLRLGDDPALDRALAVLSEPAQRRLSVLRALDDPAKTAVAIAQLDFEAARTLTPMAARYHTAMSSKRPWLAGVMSAAFPGLGQAYAGSWQGAAVAFVLNAALIGATIELGRERLYWSSAAAGLAASFFYVGNIVNAADLAHRRNETASTPAYQDLEVALVPEAHPD
jgi:hypothetical protein